MEEPFWYMGTNFGWTHFLRSCYGVFPRAVWLFFLLISEQILVGFLEVSILGMLFLVLFVCVLPVAMIGSPVSILNVKLHLVPPFIFLGVVPTDKSLGSMKSLVLNNAPSCILSNNIDGCIYCKLLSFMAVFIFFLFYWTVIVLKASNDDDT